MSTLTLSSPEVLAGDQALDSRQKIAGMTILGIFLVIMTIFLPSTFAAEEKKSPAAEALERRQKVEIMSFFLKDPDQAMMPKTTLAISLYNQAVAHFHKHEYDLARKEIQESLRHDDQNSLAYELLGEIDYQEQKLAEAKSNYQIAYNLQPREDLKNKIEKMTAEAPVEKKLSTYRGEHFLIKYHNEEKNIEAFQLRELLRRTYRDISKEFSYYFKHQVVVLLYDEADFKKITNMPHWVAGVYDGKIRMPINRVGFRDDDLRALTAHEVTHAFVHAMASSAAPAWLNEGLAEYMENKVKLQDTIVFESAIKTHNLFPIDQLISERATTSLSDTLRIALFYEQSHQLVAYLVKRYGMFRVKQMLEEYGKGKNSDEVIHNILKISPERLEKEWANTFPKV
ncbi:MAG: hypothetical protein HYZ83_03430 [Candidatus Omnitrophica bacterium]|nr:hypothetical protein [Candidatus Omnitrophota bacterium]